MQPSYWIYMKNSVSQNLVGRSTVSDGICAVDVLLNSKKPFAKAVFQSAGSIYVATKAYEFNICSSAFKKR